jgi:hypothetical protein
MQRRARPGGRALRSDQRSQGREPFADTRPGVDGASADGGLGGACDSSEGGGDDGGGAASLSADRAWVSHGRLPLADILAAGGGGAGGACWA